MSMKNTNVLLVEDDVQLRMLFSTILTQTGYTVRSAQDGFEALNEMRHRLPDLILSDLYMDGMSGFELLSVVRRRFPRIPVVAMSSAYSGTALPYGILADAFYAKGENSSALLKIVGDLYSRKTAVPARENNALVPIWVARDRSDGSKERFVYLSCRECLRSFPQIAGDGACVVHTATCLYCSIPIRYAFV